MSKPAWNLVTAVAVLLSMQGFAAREKPIYDPTFFEPCEEVVTAHIPWLKPSAQAPLRVLFVTHRRAMREVVELAQRVDMDYTVFACEATHEFGETGIGVDSSWKLIKGNSAEELAETLRKKLAADYDLIVIGNLHWNVLPLDCRYLILKKVKAGTGLVGSLPSKGRDQFIGKIMEKSEFVWRYSLWSGGAKGIKDFFGVGVFDASVDYAAAHTGDASLRITGKEVKRGSKESPRAGYHYGPIPLEPNTEYVFSMWTKTEGLAKGGAGVGFYPLPRGVAVPASAEWTHTRQTFKTGEKQVKANVYLLNHAVGTVWFDDVHLAKAGEDRNLLPNPGFEYPGPAPKGLAEGVPFASLPVFARFSKSDAADFLRKAVQTARLGTGRVGLVGYGVPKHQMLTPGPVGPVRDCRLDYDYYLATAAKLMLWAARRDDAVAVSATGAPLLKHDTAAGEPLRVAFGIRAAAAHAGVSLELTVRNRRNRVWHSATSSTDLRQGANEAAFDLPPLPNGSYFVDLRVLEAGKVLAFGSVGLGVTSPTRMAELTLAKESFTSGEALTGQAAIENPGAGLELRLEATDWHGRVVARATVPAESATAAFSLAMPPALSMTGRLEVELVRGAEVLDVSVLTYAISNYYPDRLDLQFVMWQSYPNDFIGPMVAESFTANGIDAQYGGKHKADYGPAANQWWLPYATRFVDRKTDWYQLKKTREPGDLVRSPCLTDPKYRESVRKSLIRTAEAGLNCGTLDFTLGDENHFVAGKWDLCFSDTCVADFRVWARREYGSLEALNASWGAAHKTWDEVRPLPLEECKKTGNLVPWVDHRLHMDSLWAEMHAFSRDVIREVVPTARVGYEGSDSHVKTWNAADYWKLSKAMDLNNIYYRDFPSLAWNDFVTPGTLLGAGWFGGYASNRNAPFMHWFPWRAVLKGSNSLWVWAGHGHAGAVMSFDLSMYPFFKVACAEVRELKSGIAKLLITSERQHDGIALLYSASSVHLATATDGFPDMNKVLNATVAALHDTGLEARVVPYELLAEGRVTTAEFKVLILPCAQALSGAEAAKVSEFAHAGGTVIADLRPGITDQHGKPWPTPALDELFGVTQAPAFEKGVRAIPGLGLDKVTCDASLKLADGQALSVEDGVPVVIRRQAGPGRALLLNFALDGYPSGGKGHAGVEFAGWDDGDAYRRFLADEFGKAGVVPPIRVEPLAPRVEVSRFASGDVVYVGIVQGLPYLRLEYTNRRAPAPAPRPVTVNLGRTAYVYDVRAGKYLGKKAALATDLTPGIAKLYTLLPKKGGSFTFKAPRSCAPDEVWQARVAFKTRAPGEQHVVRFRFRGPDGQERDYYAKNLLVPDQGVDASFSFALNDPPGKWRVTATDVATGVTESETVRLARK